MPPIWRIFSQQVLVNYFLCAGSLFRTGAPPCLFLSHTLPVSHLNK